MMFEAVTISVGFADYLAETMAWNRRHFDSFWIVTTPDDEATIAVAELYGCNVITTRSFYDGGAKFNKAAGINEAFSAMQRGGWVAHIDADICLPANFREILDRQATDRNQLYGMRRGFVSGRESWDRFLLTGDFRAAGIDIQAPLKLKAKWAAIGFLQIFHSSAAALDGVWPWYPPNGRHAGTTDCNFAMRFPLPSIIVDGCCWHLDVDQSVKARDWGGRVAPPWPPFEHLAKLVEK